MTGDTLNNPNQHADEGDARQHGESLYQATRDAAPRVTVFAHRAEGASGAADERWLQRVLATPAGVEILKGVIAPVSLHHTQRAAWHVIGMEKQVPGIGSIDVLYVTSSGRPVIVETKLARNPEKRREVIAQVAEYALGLRSLRVEDLVDEADADEELADLMTSIQRHLVSGSLDLVVVGDRIDDRAVALGHALINNDPTNQMSIWFVEVGLYQAPGAPATRIIVPALRQASIAEVRHTIDVAVNVASAQPADVSISVRPAQPEAPGAARRGPKLSQDELLAAIQTARGPRAVEAARSLLALASGLSLHIGMRPRSASIRLEAPNDPAKKLTIFVITAAGTFYVGYHDRWEEYAGTPPAMAERYVQRLADVFSDSPQGAIGRSYSGVWLDHLAARLDQVITIIRETVAGIRDHGADGA